MFAIIKTLAGYMVMNAETGDYVNDENGDNTFDDIKDAERILNAIQILSALENKHTTKDILQLVLALESAICLAQENAPDMIDDQDFTDRLNALQGVLADWKGV